MNNQTPIDSEDLALYAMQLLPPAEMELISVQLRHNAAARREVAELRDALAAYALTPDAQAPSASAKTRFMKEIAREPRTAPGAAASEAGVTSIGSYQRVGERVPSFLEPEAVPPRSFAIKLLPWAGWAMAAGFALTAGSLYRQREDLKNSVKTEQSQLQRTTADAAAAREILNAMNDGAAMQVTLSKSGATPQPTGRTTYSAEKGVLIFTASNMEPIDTFKVYELWLIPTNGGAPIAAGTFHPDAHGYANLISTEMPKGVEAKAFGITVENSGGAKVPTPPILMTGA